MDWLWSKSRTGKLVEGGLNLLDAAVGLGLVSGAAIATMLGKFMLAGLLGAIAIGIFLRITRRSK